MSEGKRDNSTYEAQTGKGKDSELLEKIEGSYRIYKLSGVFLKDVESDYTKDYGKLKVARLRFEFARQELILLLEEARSRGLRWRDNEFIQKYFYQSPYNDGVKDYSDMSK